VSLVTDTGTSGHFLRGIKTGHREAKDRNTEQTPAIMEPLLCQLPGNLSHVCLSINIKDNFFVQFSLNYTTMKFSTIHV
jgi:hypothetical protein